MFLALPCVVRGAVKPSGFWGQFFYACRTVERNAQKWTTKIDFGKQPEFQILVLSGRKKSGKYFDKINKSHIPVFHKSNQNTEFCFSTVFLLAFSFSTSSWCNSEWFLSCWISWTTLGYTRLLNICLTKRLVVQLFNKELLGQEAHLQSLHPHKSILCSHIFCRF